jgi:hypothetical protein
MIRPEFWEDTKMAKLSAYARLFFISMWNFADDEGYLPYDTEWLKVKCMPFDKVNIEKLLEELNYSGRINWNNDIINIKNFLKYQKINRPYPSHYKSLFNEHSLNGSEHSSQEVKEKLKEREKEREIEREVTTTTKFMIPQIDEVEAYGASIGFKINGDQFCSYYTSKGWLLGKSPMKDWKAAVRTWKIKDNSDKPQELKQTHRLVKLNCSNCNEEINTRILVNQDICGLTCKHCGRKSLQEII